MQAQSKITERSWSFMAMLLCALTLLSGCQNTAKTVTLSDLIIAEPLEVHYRKELHLARLNEILNTAEITAQERARLLYERGVVYDELGLKFLARFDFNQALQLKPDLAEAYNFLGVYMTLTRNFDSAYEAFDSANELKPDYQFAFFSRGIALYYGNRAKLGAQDLKHFYDFKPSDPYRILWQYIVQSKFDKAYALSELKNNAALAAQGEWASDIVKLYLNELSEKAFLSSLADNRLTSQQQAERLCEAYFYLGKYRDINGDSEAAQDFYKLALATNVYGFIEHKYARLELDLHRLP